MQFIKYENKYILYSILQYNKIIYKNNINAQLKKIFENWLLKF